MSEEICVVTKLGNRLIDENAVELEAVKAFKDESKAIDFIIDDTAKELLDLRKKGVGTKTYAFDGVSACIIDSAFHMTIFEWVLHHVRPE